MLRICAAAVLAGCVVGAPVLAGIDPTTFRPLSVAKLPFCELAPAKYDPNLCLYHYRVSTSSPECQAFMDQGLGYWYSYVWMEAARCFETAATYDPDCAMAWWGLSRSLERWGKGDHAKALLEADKRKSHASYREQQLILARMQEKGQVAGVGDEEARRKAAITTIDNLLAVYDEDEEAWYYRAQLAGGSGLFGGVVAAVPFYKALCRINPMHPGANHELLHFYENYRRPALGWQHAERYIASSPAIPHPFHMQAHLATRLGRWDKTSDRSARAIELEKAYHARMAVKPADDHQYGHHLEVLLLSLTHDGRFAEGRAVKDEGKKTGYKPWVPWFRLHLAERAWDDARAIAEEQRRHDKLTASYLSALLYLKQGNPARALPEIEVLQHAFARHRDDRRLELRLWETQGIYMCQTGAIDQGLKLLAKTVEATKDDFSHHSWGNGAYYMEAWGEAALLAGKDAVAEEAFLEALAHDPRSVRGALGLQVLCERQKRTEEAARFAALAHRCWAKADPGKLELELAALRAERPTAH